VPAAVAGGRGGSGAHDKGTGSSSSSGSISGSSRRRRREEEEAADLARLTWALSVPVHYALTPLVFTPREQPLVAAGLAAFTLWSWGALRAAHGPAALRCDFGGWRWGRQQQQQRAAAAAADARCCLPAWEQVYLAGFVPLHGLALCHGALLPALPFAALAATSLYCAVGVAVGTCRLYAHALRALRAGGAGEERR
jgi:hypothetical protein